MSEAVLFKDVDFAYEHRSVLRKTSLRVEDGEFVGIIGPNGGGKTTLLRLMMGLLKPQKGRIELYGQGPKEGRCEVGYVPQVLPFDPSFPISALELVLSGRLSHLPWYGSYSKESVERAMAALERVGMAAEAHTTFGQLSGGQRQRVLIARALVDDPKLLVLDEALSNIDAQAVGVMRELLQQLHGNKTIMMVTHDLHTAIHEVDRVVCVQNEVYGLKPKEVCEHFAMGLYHAPLLTPREKS